MSSLIQTIIDHKMKEKRPKNREQAEIMAMFQGKSFRDIKQEILEISDDGIITIKRNRTVYKIKKSDKQPKRWDFIFFRYGEYQSPWFNKSKNNFYLLTKSDGDYVYFDDLDGFGAYLHKKYVDVYEVIERIRK